MKPLLYGNPNQAGEGDGQSRLSKSGLFYTGNPDGSHTIRSCTFLDVFEANKNMIMMSWWTYGLKPLPP